MWKSVIIIIVWVTPTKIPSDSLLIPDQTHEYGSGEWSTESCTTIATELFLRSTDSLH